MFSFQLKLAVINILSSRIFTEAEILPLLIGAIALGPSEVEVAGDVAIKKIDLEKVLRNKDTVNSLFNLYLGVSLQVFFIVFTSYIILCCCKIIQVKVISAILNHRLIKKFCILALESFFQKLDESDRVLPATIPIKLKLMPLLMRSPVAVQTFPCNIKVNYIYLCQVFLERFFPFQFSFQFFNSRSELRLKA